MGGKGTRVKVWGLTRLQVDQSDRKTCTDQEQYTVSRQTWCGLEQCIAVCMCAYLSTWYRWRDLVSCFRAAVLSCPQTTSLAIIGS